MPFGVLKRLRRKRAAQRPFPETWEQILRTGFPRFGKLSAEDQAELRDLIKIFLAEKEFEGAAGLEITDDIRVTIAAQACMLLLHRETDIYPGLYSIVVYPRDYIVNASQRAPDGVVSETMQIRRGETAARGAVVLTWDAARRGASDVHDCRNVVFHEFAHQLDAQDGAFDGTPILRDRSMYIAWARVLGDEFSALRDRVQTHQPTDLDPYGATNPAEFFAVVTECFFQSPKQFRERHPELYDELRGFYQQDPTDSA